MVIGSGVRVRVHRTRLTGHLTYSPVSTAGREAWVAIKMSWHLSLYRSMFFLCSQVEIVNMVAKMLL